MSVTYP